MPRILSRALPLVVLLAAVSSLPVCAVGARGGQPEDRSGPAPVGDENEAQRVKDWIGPDREISRGLALMYRDRMAALPDPAALYRKEVRYVAPVDSIGLAEFRSLPPALQLERREIAKDYLDRAFRFQMLVKQLVNIFRAEDLVVGEPSSFLEGMARFMGALLNANGVDPSAPEAWYDLAFAYGVTGDLKRQRLALDAALAAIGQDPGGRFQALRRRIALDLGWTCRDRGLLQEGQEWVDESDALAPPDEEAKVLRGLLLADAGKFTEACRLAEEVGSIRVHVKMWGWLDTDFAKRWIQSAAYRARGDLPMACFVLGRVHPEYRIPFAHRYYNDVGLMCELNGQVRQAREYYGLAMIHRPYFIYYPITSTGGPWRVFGLPGSGYPYCLAYDRFLVAGSLYSHASYLVGACGIEEDPARRAALAEQAVEELTVCRRRDIRPTAAVALRGRVHFVTGDFERAVADLALACDEFARQGRSDPAVCALAGMLEVVLDRYREAMPHLARALKAGPDNAKAWGSLGIAAAYENDRATARKAFDTAIDLAPGSPISWYNRGLLNFNARRWEEACSDLAEAGRLAPGDERFAAVLERAEKARDLNSPSSEPASESDRTGEVGERSGTESAAAAPSGFLLDVSADSLVFDDQMEPDAVAALYSGDPFAGVDQGEAAAGGDGLRLSAADLQRVVEVLEREFRADPLRARRRDLALAYVRSGRSAEGRALLESQTGLQVDEMCILLEADRALGDAALARSLARSLADGPPAIRDPVFWSLVAFTCLDMGLNEEGLVALDAAISFDPDNQALKNQRRFLSGMKR